MKIKTTNLPLKTIREAQGIAGGCYHMNARTSYGYGFNVGNDNTISKGMFLDTDDELHEFDGAIFFRDKTIDQMGKTFKAHTLLDIQSGETRILS